MIEPIQVIDSHTAGEPTRVVVAGGPPLLGATVQEQSEHFVEEFDRYRTAIVTEPRGSDVLVGALLCETTREDCLAGVIFFNNVGVLGMCGHGMIGVVQTLGHLGRIGGGECKIETPVGVVNTSLNGDGSVTIGNVPSFRAAQNVEVDVDGVGTVVGDVAWGGNWFFLVRQPQRRLELARVAELQRVASSIRLAINRAGHPEVDHVELFGEPIEAGSDSRNFVLCPGLEYDRSPCGTGTSAKLACLAADGKLSPGQTWVQEGILGTKFVARYDWSDESRQRIDPKITGSAHVTGEAKLLLDSADPFCWGIGTARPSPPSRPH